MFIFYIELWIEITTERHKYPLETPTKVEVRGQEALQKTHQFPLPSLLEKVNKISLPIWIDGMNPVKKLRCDGHQLM